MRFNETGLAGVFLIEPEPARDHRGFFMRTFCRDEFTAAGLATEFMQHNTSLTVAKGAVRGMHFQVPPHGEIKVVSCVRGCILDVIIDLRSNSKTHGQWQSFELSAENRNQLYIPVGFAHGFQAMTDNVEVCYLISEFYTPEAARGVRHDDPAFNISWPLPVTDLSDKDRAWPNYTAENWFGSSGGAA